MPHPGKQAEKTCFPGWGICLCWINVLAAPQIMEKDRSDLGIYAIIKL